MQLQGQVKAIMPVKTKNDFKSVELVLTIDFNSKYPQHVTFQATQNKVDLVSDLNVGDLITIEFNLNGREWQNPNTLETKFFNTLSVWKITKN